MGFKILERLDLRNTRMEDVDVKSFLTKKSLTHLYSGSDIDIGGIKSILTDSELKAWEASRGFIALPHSMFKSLNENLKHANDDVEDELQVKKCRLSPQEDEQLETNDSNWTASNKENDRMLSWSASNTVMRYNRRAVPRPIRNYLFRSENDNSSLADETENLTYNPDLQSADADVSKNKKVELENDEQPECRPSTSDSRSGYVSEERGGLSFEPSTSGFSWGHAREEEEGLSSGPVASNVASENDPKYRSQIVSKVAQATSSCVASTSGSRSSHKEAVGVAGATSTKDIDGKVAAAISEYSTPVVSDQRNCDKIPSADQAGPSHAGIAADNARAPDQPGPSNSGTRHRRPRKGKAKKLTKYMRSRRTKSKASKSKVVVNRTELYKMTVSGQAETAKEIIDQAGKLASYVSNAIADQGDRMDAVIQDQLWQGVNGLNAMAMQSGADPREEREPRNITITRVETDSPDTPGFKREIVKITATMSKPKPDSYRDIDHISYPGDSMEIALRDVPIEEDARVRRYRDEPSTSGLSQNVHNQQSNQAQWNPGVTQEVDSDDEMEEAANQDVGPLPRCHGQDAVMLNEADNQENNAYLQYPLIEAAATAPNQVNMAMPHLEPLMEQSVEVPHAYYPPLNEQLGQYDNAAPPIHNPVIDHRFVAGMQHPNNQVPGAQEAPPIQNRRFNDRCRLCVEGLHHPDREPGIMNVQQIEHMKRLLCQILFCQATAIPTGQFIYFGFMPRPRGYVPPPNLSGRMPTIYFKGDELPMEYYRMKEMEQTLNEDEGEDEGEDEEDIDLPPHYNGLHANQNPQPHLHADPRVEQHRVHEHYYAGAAAQGPQYAGAAAQGPQYAGAPAQGPQYAGAVAQGPQYAPHPEAAFHIADQSQMQPQPEESDLESEFDEEEAAHKYDPAAEYDPACNLASEYDPACEHPSEDEPVSDEEETGSVHAVYKLASGGDVQSANDSVHYESAPSRAYEQALEKEHEQEQFAGQAPSPHDHETMSVSEEELERPEEIVFEQAQSPDFEGLESSDEDVVSEQAQSPDLEGLESSKDVVFEQAQPAELKGLEHPEEIIFEQVQSPDLEGLESSEDVILEQAQPAELEVLERPEEIILKQAQSPDLEGLESSKDVVFEQAQPAELEGLERPEEVIFEQAQSPELEGLERPEEVVFEQAQPAELEAPDDMSVSELENNQPNVEAVESNVSEPAAAMQRIGKKRPLQQPQKEAFRINESVISTDRADEFFKRINARILKIMAHDLSLLKTSEAQVATKPDETNGKASSSESEEEEDSEESEDEEVEDENEDSDQSSEYEDPSTLRRPRRPIRIPPEVVDYNARNVIILNFNRAGPPTVEAHRMNEVFIPHLETIAPGPNVTDEVVFCQWGCSQIKVISFKGCKQVTDMFLYNLSTHNLPSLQVLDLRGTSVTSAGVSDYFEFVRRMVTIHY